MKFRYLLYFLALIFVSANSAIAGTFIQLDAKQIAAVKASIEDKTASEATLKAYRSLIERSDTLLNADVFTVTDKTILAPTGDPHDYLSISRYWWPDGNKRNGLPWTRRDGETNPDTQTDKVDRKRIGEMTQTVESLGQAYYFSGNEAYAKKGTDLIKAWFLNSDTRMNPNLNYAQSVPGIDKQRRSGILDGRLIPLRVLDSITLFSGSEHWSDEENESMNNWLKAYLKWLTKSQLGKEGAKQENNHGSWYRFQTTALAFYLGEEKLFARELKQTKKAMGKQFNDEGAQKHELKRTKSFYYSCFNLDAVTRIAVIAERADQSLWDYPSTEKSELSQAIDFLMPTALGEPWPYPTKGINLDSFLPVLSRWVDQTNNTEHKKLLKKLLHESQNAASDEQGKLSLYDSFALFNPDALN